uniref:Selenoprotein O n=1 Tax=Cyprinus carpio TaxID=7962 RepID=A0A8C1ZHN7_CYPCA
MASAGARLARLYISCSGVILRRSLSHAGMDDMGISTSRSCLEGLEFDNVALKKLPLDPSTEPGVRQVRGACFSRVQPTPLKNPKFAAVSGPALALLGLDADEVLKDPLGPEYLSGSKVMSGSEPAAHCYCGHQFGQFAGQLGDGAACYLGEVKAPVDQSSELLHENPTGRWEIQVKGAGLTPYSRQADGRKVLRSSIREFLCSEAVFALGVPTTRAGSVVTSDSRVMRDINYDGHPRMERCSVVLRIAPSFIRFGSFEIFKRADEFTGRQGPSYGHDEIRTQMLDYVIETFYPEIHQNHSDPHLKKKCYPFFYFIFFFFSSFDPDFICNASDTSGRYSYQAQPAICRWNLARLAEALVPDLPPDRAEQVLDEYLPLYNGFYLSNMRKKLGLLMMEEPEDEMLITELMQTMHNTGADFTNTFRSLSQISCPTQQEGEDETEAIKQATELLLQQCASLEELKAANRPTMDPRELAMLLSMAQSNPALFQMISDRKTVARQLERLSRLKELMDTTAEQLRAKQTEDWSCWIRKYRQRLARECESGIDVTDLQKERVHVMNNNNPYVVLRNYIAQNAIEAAENGDFSEVQRVLKVLEKPFSVQEGLEKPGWVGRGGAVDSGERDETGEQGNTSGAEARVLVPYDSKPPMWANEICVT